MPALHSTYSVNDFRLTIILLVLTHLSAVPKLEAQSPLANNYEHLSCQEHIPASRHSL